MARRLPLATLGSIAFAGLACFGAGVATAYLFDSRSGNRRRSILLGRLVHAQHAVERELGYRTHDFVNRAQGAVAGTRTRLERDTDEDVLCERVRAKIGHVCTHPSAIAVNPKGKGIIELKGQILAGEHHKVLHAVRTVPGVRGIDDDLEPRLTNTGWWPRHGPRTLS